MSRESIPGRGVNKLVQTSRGRNKEPCIAGGKVGESSRRRHQRGSGARLSGDLLVIVGACMS